MAATLRLKRKQHSQRPPYGQGGFAASGPCRAPGGGVFGLLISSPAEPPAQRDGRKRRNEKRITRVNRTLTPYFDGHLWRKYGQKTIKDSPYQRLYFRCSYREDRHCMASKLVQQVTNDAPPLYEVSYMYEHTCNAAPVPAPDVDAADAGADEPPADAAGGGGLVLRFGSSSGGGNGKHHGGAGTTLQLQEQQQYDHQSESVLPQSPFAVNLDCPNGSELHSVPASHVTPPPAQLVSSPSFPITVESEETLPSTDEDELDEIMLSKFDWNSFLYDLDDNLHFSGQSCEIFT